MQIKWPDTIHYTLNHQPTCSSLSLRSLISSIRCWRAFASALSFSPSSKCPLRSSTFTDSLILIWSCTFLPCSRRRRCQACEGMEWEHVWMKVIEINKLRSLTDWRHRLDDSNLRLFCQCHAHLFLGVFGFVCSNDFLLSRKHALKLETVLCALNRKVVLLI